MICFLREWGTLQGYSASIPGARPGKLTGLACNPDDSWPVESLLCSIEGSVKECPIALVRRIDDRHNTLSIDAEAFEPANADTGRLTDVAMLIGFDVIGRDGELVGPVTDFLVNVRTWELRYLVVRSDSKSLLLAPQWIQTSEADEKRITVDLPAAALLQAPAYSGMHELSRGYEESLYRHYTNRVYCADEFPDRTGSDTQRPSPVRSVLQFSQAQDSPP